jgi:hypothetical protein
MPDKRMEASRQRAVVSLLLERHRLQEAIEAETESIETCALFGIKTSERRLNLLKSELDELQPNRRPTTPTEGDTDGPAR